MTTINAKVILDSISPEDKRLTTVEITYPRFIHAEFMTHRVFSRNASSSRAIPVSKLIEQVETNPAIPVRWGLNGKGMQDHGEMSEFGKKRALSIWLKQRDQAVAAAKELVSSPEMPHKQIVNRLLEPFAHITVIVTATEWNNFFHLRVDEAADPTMRALASEVHAVISASSPAKLEPGEWHLPYLDDHTINELLSPLEGLLVKGSITPEGAEYQALEMGRKISAARCARVSYLNHDKTRPTIEQDLGTFDILIKSGKLHGSPLEHQATPDLWTPDGWAEPHYHGNFDGWVQYRKTWVGENVPGNLPAVNYNQED